MIDKIIDRGRNARPEPVTTEVVSRMDTDRIADIYQDCNDTNIRALHGDRLVRLSRDCCGL
jgi:hypothetical protein